MGDKPILGLEKPELDDIEDSGLDFQVAALAEGGQISGLTVGRVAVQVVGGEGVAVSGIMGMATALTSPARLLLDAVGDVAPVRSVAHKSLSRSFI